MNRIIKNSVVTNLDEKPDVCKPKIELIDRLGTVICPLCIENKSDVKLIKLSSDYLYGTFALCKDCREELIKALGVVND